jgi:hypothetical protein
MKLNVSLIVIDRADTSRSSCIAVISMTQHYPQAHNISSRARRFVLKGILLFIRYRFSFNICTFLVPIDASSFGENYLSF